MPRITPFSVALACGVAGAYVDVTSYASWAPGEGVAGSWGRQDQFRDTTPGAWSIYLDNYDGRFTPDATNGILATPLTEGMGMSWQLGTRIIAGTILGFTMIDDNWGRIRIDCDDMLGNAARTDVTLTARGMVLGANPYLYWPFNDAVGSIYGTEQSGNIQPGFDGTINGTAAPTFGATAIPALGETQASVQNQFPVFATAGYSPYGPVFPVGAFSTISYATNSMGTWGAWMTATGASPALQVFIYANGFTHSMRFGIDNTGAYVAQMGSATLVSSTPVVVGVPAYLQLVVTNSGSTSITGEFFINGVSQGTLVWVGIAPDGNGLATNALRTPSTVLVASPAGGPAGAPVVISHLSHTPKPVPEYTLAYGTEAGLLAALAATTSSLALGTIPSDLSTAPTAPQSGTSSALAKLNDLIRSEQGYLSCTTSGSLTSPSQVVTVRARQRPATVSYSFDAQLELAAQPDFLRDLTNLVASATAQGPTTSTTYLDPTASARAGSSNTSDAIDSTAFVDQLGYAQDRILRGKNTALRVASFTVDALVTPTDRSADLLAIAFGDRVSITNIPSTVIGATSWDGWVIGRSEAQDIGQHKFTFYVAPVLPATAIYDANLYMADGALTLQSAINASVTTMSVQTSGPKLETVAVPYGLLIDSEQVTVTACTSATPQVATITRAVNGTTAASHTTSAVIELATPSLYAF